MSKCFLYSFYIDTSPFSMLPNIFSRNFSYFFFVIVSITLSNFPSRFFSYVCLQQFNYNYIKVYYYWAFNWTISSKLRHADTESKLLSIWFSKSIIFLLYLGYFGIHIPSYLFRYIQSFICLSKSYIYVIQLNEPTK